MPLSPCLSFQRQRAWLTPAILGIWAAGFLRMLQADDGSAEAAPISNELETIRQRHAVPALAAAAMQAGKVLAIGVCGVRKFGSPELVQLEDAWHIGSCTKSMTASLAAMLVEKGELNWTTTVAEVFPQWRGEMAEPWRAVTLQQLLTHRSGAPAQPPAALWQKAGERRGAPVEQRLAFTHALLAQPPEAAPGTKFIYSNQGYAIAGTMLEEISGQPWETLMRDRLFAPLGMKSAGFGEPASVDKADAPWGHVMQGGNPVPVPPGPGADNPPAIGPAGTVHCSVRDLALYASWHARGARAGATLLNDASFTALHTPAAGGNYALGWGVEPRPWAGGNALTHTGSNTMFYAVMWVAPEKEAAFVAATNIAGDAAAQACDEAVSTLVQRFLK